MLVVKNFRVCDTTQESIGEGWKKRPIKKMRRMVQRLLVEGFSGCFFETRADQALGEIVKEGTSCAVSQG